MAKRVSKGISIARPGVVVGSAMLVGDGERVNVGLHVDDKAAEGRQRRTKDAHVHHDLIPDTTVNTIPWRRISAVFLGKFRESLQVLSAPAL